MFQDETGFTLHRRLGFGWAPRGQRLRVPTTSSHRDRVNLSGWVAPLLGRYGTIRTEHGNRDAFLEVLRDMYRLLRGMEIFLYVDGAGWHKARQSETSCAPIRDCTWSTCRPTSQRSTCRSESGAGFSTRPPPIAGSPRSTTSGTLFNARPKLGLRER